jgi:hypothetical protein
MEGSVLEVHFKKPPGTISFPSHPPKTFDISNNKGEGLQSKKVIHLYINYYLP